MSKFSKRNEESKKEFIDILFYLYNQIIVINQLSGTSLYRTEQ
jgi:hypothetical protein